jgi:hypothetical protein
MRRAQGSITSKYRSGSIFRAATWLSRENFTGELFHPH